MSFWSVITFLLSTIAFWFARRHIEQTLDEHGFETSPTRKVLTFSLAVLAALMLVKLLDATGNFFSPEPENKPIIVIQKTN